ncbi:purple acid phosphatase [Micractinium conductrix]|uniref:Purple acid phosphatase n=1 Tax=Micractinium conductrix TaxID=554055 RepID=A0A2P6V243_9CHLO|nr:purple acid phosphatase [Micractinium conductrix]|eukprot:PSC68114.1 purple acid phosphatase [Micractinium conductrix]
MDTSSDSSEWLDSDSDWEPELEGAACKPAAAAAAAAAGGSKAGGVELRAVFGCSRRQPEKESRQPSHKNPVASKKAGCLFELRVEVENGIAEVTERHGHNGHTPGNSEDVRWLPPCAAVVAKIEETLLPVIAAAHNSGGDAAGSPPRLPAAPSAPASSTPSAPAAPTAAPVLDQTPSMAVGKAVVDPKRKKRGRIAAMGDKGAFVDWEGEQVKRRRAVQLDSLRVLPLLDSTQRSEPTADRQRILVTAGAHTYKRGTIVSFNKGKCLVDLDGDSNNDGEAAAAAGAGHSEGASAMAAAAAGCSGKGGSSRVQIETQHLHLISDGAAAPAPVVTVPPRSEPVKMPIGTQSSSGVMHTGPAAATTGIKAWNACADGLCWRKVSSLGAGGTTGWVRESSGIQMMSAAACNPTPACTAFPDPPTNCAAPAPVDLSFFVIGDWGWQGSNNQTQVANLMGSRVQGRSPSFVLSTGENFYRRGLSSTADPLFDSSFINVYTQADLQGVPWHAVLGNHDYNEGTFCAMCGLSPNHQLGTGPGTLNARDARWHAYRNTSLLLAGGQVEIFLIDTPPFHVAYKDQPWATYPGGILQQSWQQQYCSLKARLVASCAPWKLAVGHHPTRSNGNGHGNTAELITWLEPLFFATACRYACVGGWAMFAGHDHSTSS